MPLLLLQGKKHGYNHIFLSKLMFLLITLTNLNDIASMF
jgi:hypothetical protein